MVIYENIYDKKMSANIFPGNNRKICVIIDINSGQHIFVYRDIMYTETQIK